MVALRTAGDQPHLADRGVWSEAAYTNRASILQLHDDTHPAFKNEMHAVGRVALGGDNVAPSELESLAAFGQLLPIVHVAESLGEPFPQAATVATFARMGGNDALSQDSNA